MVTASLSQRDSTMATNGKADKKQSVLIEVPLGTPPNDDSYEQQKVNRGIVSVEAKLGKQAAIAFVRVRNGLRAQNAKLENGRPVWSNADTIKWMMEQVDQ